MTDRAAAAQSPSPVPDGPRGPDVADSGRRTGRLQSPPARAILFALLAGAVYLPITGGWSCRFQQSECAHHVYLADAMLHGQLYLRPEAVRAMIERGREAAERRLAEMEAAEGHPILLARRSAFVQQWLRQGRFQDWSIVDGRYYGYWSPLLPAVTVPFVAVFGDGASDRLLAALLGMINVTLFYLLLRRADRSGLCVTSESCRCLFTVLFAFGTVHFWIACLGWVWQSAQLVTLTAVLLACLAACAPANRRRDVLLCGIAFGLALLGRTIVAALGLFFVVLIWQRSRVRPGEPRTSVRADAISQGISTARTEVRGSLGLKRRLALFILPCMAAVAVQGWYNYARFGSALDSGQNALMKTTSEPGLVPNYERYGQFHPHFIARNARYYFWNWRPTQDAQGRLAPDPDGNSMFLVTPPLLFALLAWRRGRGFPTALACGVVPFLVALLLFRATGYTQFGNRYLLESMPLLLLLAICGTRGRATWPAVVLTLAAIIVNAAGTHWMLRNLG